VSWTRRQKIKNDAIYVLVWIALSIARVMPRAVLIAIGRALGWIAWTLARGTRALAIENASRLDRSIARASFLELGALLGDTIALWRGDAIRLEFAPGARDVLDRARSHGRGVVLVTAHLGPWERLAAALVHGGFPLTTPVRTSYDARLEALLHAPLRRAYGVHAIDRDAPSTPRALIRALRANEVAGFLIDLNTRVASTPVDFFGAPAWTPTGPARVAIRTGTPVVAAFATRDGITVELVRDASPPMRDDDAVLALTAELTHVVERAIRREPDRWIWMHDRWGRPRTKTNEPAFSAGPDAIEASI
jgi:Kdo2-lipid IVA lauroyltransferase/acyltransferase